MSCLWLFFLEAYPFDFAYILIKKLREEEDKEIKNDSAGEAVQMSYLKEQADLMDMRREAIALGEKRGEKRG